MIEALLLTVIAVGVLLAVVLLLFRGHDQQSLRIDKIEDRLEGLEATQVRQGALLRETRELATPRRAEDALSAWRELYGSEEQETEIDG